MAITIDYSTFEINVPKADTVFVRLDPINGKEVRSLDMDFFWKALADIQDDQEGVWASTCFINTPPQDLGSFTLGRSVLIQAPYFVHFENGNYAVELVGGNNNISSRSVVNFVAINSNNTAGLVQIEGGDSIWTEEEKDLIIADVEETKEWARKSSDNAEQANLKL